jgi:hypothetical protein
VLVGGLGHDGVVGAVRHGLAERDDGLRHADLGAAHEVVLQVLQADLQVELAGAWGGGCKGWEGDWRGKHDASGSRAAVAQLCAALHAAAAVKRLPRATGPPKHAVPATHRR